MPDNIPTGPSYRRERDTRQNRDPYRDERRDRDREREQSRRSYRDDDGFKPQSQQPSDSMRRGGATRDSNRSGNGSGYLPPRSGSGAGGGAERERDSRAPRRDYGYNSSSNNNARGSSFRQRDRSPSYASRNNNTRSDIVPLDQLPRPQNSRWDIAPTGFENVNAEKMKAVGLFVKFGPRRGHIDYRKVMALLNNGNQNNGEENSSGQQQQQGNGHHHHSLVSSAEVTKLDPMNSKLSRVVILEVSEELLMTEANVQEILQFFNSFMITLDTDDNEGKERVIATHMVVNEGKKLIIEFINSAIATIAIALNGQTCPLTTSDITLKVLRPHGYITGNVQTESESETEGSSNDKIVLKNISKDSNESDIKEFIKEQCGLEDVATLRVNLLRNEITQESSGIAFISGPGSIDIDKLNGGELNGEKVSCFNACDSRYKQTTHVTYTNIAESAKGTSSTSLTESSVVMFLNCVDLKDFQTDQNYEWLKKDFFIQCSTFGKVKEIKIPRPSSTDKLQFLIPDDNGVGKIFVKFEDVSSAVNAVDSMAGYRYGERTVCTTFIDEQDYNDLFFLAANI